MICLIENRLYFGPSPKSRDFKDIFKEDGKDDWIFINLREKTDTSHWYQKEKQFEFYNYPIDKEEFKVKDILDISKRCLKHCNNNNNKLIYIHNIDGKKTEALVAFSLYIFITKIKNFDPLAFLEDRDLYDYFESREEKDVLKMVCNESQKLARWLIWQQNK